MFIELTDHLRCPAGHPEQFLVLLPGAMQGRRVVSGELGCPVCGTVVRVADGEVDFGGSHPASGQTALTAEAVAAFLGLSGPGGYVALVGAVAALAPDLAALLPDIGLVLVNPPSGTAPDGAAGLLRAARLPLKSNSLRGIALGPDAATDPGWLQAAAGAVLPGLRMVAEGGEPPAELVEVLARSAECWVGRRKRGG